MLAKITAKNQLTLLKSITSTLGPVEYFEVGVRTKLAELDLTEQDLADAVEWARKGAKSGDA